MQAEQTAIVVLVSRSVAASRSKKKWEGRGWENRRGRGREEERGKEGGIVQL